MQVFKTKENSKVGKDWQSTPNTHCCLVTLLIIPVTHIRNYVKKNVCHNEHNVTAAVYLCKCIIGAVFDSLVRPYF